MDEAQMSRYWCHVCSEIVIPVVEIEAVKCAICQSGFIEEMSTAGSETPPPPPAGDFGASASFSGSDRALSLWAPVLLGMMSNPRRRHRRFRRLEFEDDNDNDNNDDRDVELDSHLHQYHGEETEIDRELESIIQRRRRRRSSATILRLLQVIQAVMLSESDNSRNDVRPPRDREIRDGEHVILISPYNQTIVQDSYDSNDSNPQNQPFGSLGDYFVGPGLELLLQHLAENDPNRYGRHQLRKRTWKLCHP